MWITTIPLVIFLIYEALQCLYLRREQEYRDISVTSIPNSIAAALAAAGILTAVCLLLFSQADKLNLILSAAFVTLFIINKRKRKKISESDREE